MFQTSKKEFRSAGGILQSAHPALLAHVKELVEVVRGDFAAQDLSLLCAFLYDVVHQQELEKTIIHVYLGECLFW